MNRYDRAEAIVLPAEHHLQFMLLQLDPRSRERSFGLARGLGIVGALFLGHLKKHARLLEAFAQTLESFQLAFDLILFAQNGLRILRAIPEFLFAGLFEEFFLAGGQLGEVKDASRACRRGIRNRSVAL
jgi:hypothetical protein